MRALLPGRHGKLVSAPVPQLVSHSETVPYLGVMHYQYNSLADSLFASKLVLLAESEEYTSSLAGGATALVKEGESFRLRASSLPLNDNAFGALTGRGDGSVHVQIENELFFCSHSGSRVYRFYVDSSNGDNYRAAGITTPSAATVGYTATGLTGTFLYKVVALDEKGRRSSPSASVTATPANQKVDLTLTALYSSGTNGGQGIAQYEIYRTTNGSSVYYLLTTLTDPTSTYQDNIADATIQVGRVAPSPGENDPGSGFLTGGVAVLGSFRGRLIAASIFSSDLMVSNYDNPTQFSSISTPDVATDGATYSIGGGASGQIMGVVSFGTVLGILTERAYYQLWGNDLSDFQIRKVADVGCVSRRSVVAMNNLVLFLSGDGVRAIGGDGNILDARISAPLDSELFGLLEPHDGDVPGVYYAPGSTALGLTEATSLYDAPIDSRVARTQAFAGRMDSRYYLCIANRTFVYDTETEGWSEVDYGFINQFLSVEVDAGYGHRIFYMVSLHDSTAQVPAAAPIPGYYKGALYGCVSTIPNARWGGGVASAASHSDEVMSPIPTYPMKPKLVTRPFITQGSAYQPGDLRAVEKRAVVLTVWGRWDGDVQGVIGKVTLVADDGYRETYSMYSGIKFPQGVLWKQEFSPAMRGSLIHAELEFEEPYVELGEIQLEYVVVG